MQKSGQATLQKWRDSDWVRGRRGFCFFGAAKDSKILLPAPMGVATMVVGAAVEVTWA
jgi:hypothetical protein